MNKLAGKMQAAAATTKKPKQDSQTQKRTEHRSAQNTEAPEEYVRSRGGHLEPGKRFPRRITLDLSNDQNDTLAEMAIELGATKAEVLRELIAQAATDSALADAVGARVRDTRRSAL